MVPLTLSTVMQPLSPAVATTCPVVCVFSFRATKTTCFSKYYKKQKRARTKQWNACDTSVINRVRGRLVCMCMCVCARAYATKFILQSTSRDVVTRLAVDRDHGRSNMGVHAARRKIPRVFSEGPCACVHACVCVLDTDVPQAIPPK